MLDTAKIKQQLEDRLRELGARVDEIEVDLRATPNENWTEKATETEQDEMLEALESSALAEVAKIRAALVRLRDGTYGACATCGEDIGAARLDAVPYTPQCINCAQGKTPD
ncbi:MAG: TraR/DksA family transcriptional regulator [Rhodospirillales bacterium]|nr:TraR/DksA family transcriptional regulator [Rhodospirillales bacterium]